MIIYCEMKLWLPVVYSLKDKRSIIKSLQEKLKNKFNVAVAELAENDLWKNSTIGIVSVSANKRFLEQLINKIISFIDEFAGIEISNYTSKYY